MSKVQRRTAKRCDRCKKPFGKPGQRVPKEQRAIKSGRRIICYACWQALSAPYATPASPSATLGTCGECGRPITDAGSYTSDDGRLICHRCFAKPPTPALLREWCFIQHKHWVSDSALITTVSYAWKHMRRLAAKLHVSYPRQPEAAGSREETERQLDRVVEWCSEQMVQAPAAAAPEVSATVPPESATVAPTPPRGVDEETARIIEALAENAPMLLTQEAIEHEARVARRTVSARLPKLLDAGWVEQPNGPKSGTTITDAGKTLLAQIEDTDVGKKWLEKIRRDKVARKADAAQ
jgi:DNA-binding MarR family transcriptional regulator